MFPFWGFSRDMFRLVSYEILGKTTTQTSFLPIVCSARVPPFFFIESHSGYSPSPLTAVVARGSTCALTSLPPIVCSATCPSFTEIFPRIFLFTSCRCGCWGKHCMTSCRKDMYVCEILPDAWQTTVYSQRILCFMVQRVSLSLSWALMWGDSPKQAVRKKLVVAQNSTVATDHGCPGCTTTISWIL